MDKPKYFVVKQDPKYFDLTWGHIFTRGETLGWTGNDFNGCTTYKAKNGNVVVKMAA